MVGFSIHQKCVELDNDGVVQHHTFECSFFDKPISNQVIDINHQWQRLSRKIICPWYINITSSKSSSEIRVTSIIRQHNHPIIPDTYLYAPKYYCLLDDIMKRIEFYVTKGNMGSKQIGCKFSGSIYS